jgi:hypothetical protein
MTDPLDPFAHLHDVAHLGTVDLPTPKREHGSIGRENVGQFRPACNEAGETRRRR